MTSQFKYYSSTDVGAPVLNATSGSLQSILDGCLVNGYGSKTPVGWSKPIANDGYLGCWQQPSGSKLTLFVNDSAPQTSSGAGGGAREAWATGWESMTGLTGSATFTGQGYGQFPYYGLGLLVANTGINAGAVIVRKSNTNDTTTRNWLLFGDAHTFYLFTAPVDTAGVYNVLFFGDIFSIKSGTDTHKCVIAGRTVVGSTAQYCGNDVITLPTITVGNMFIARNAFGIGLPLSVNKVGDVGKGAVVSVQVPLNSSVAGCPMAGIIPVANTPDNSLYMSPIWVSEASSGTIRGRMRGMYHLCHPISAFADGQIFSGANEFAGKTFQIVKQGSANGMWVIEISNTVETN